VTQLDHTSETALAQLLPLQIDTEMHAMLRIAGEIYRANPEIEERIHADQEFAALLDKRLRVADATFDKIGGTTATLFDLDLYAPPVGELKLEDTGCPRMAPIVVYYLMVFRGYTGSTCGRAYERLADSLTMRNFLEPHVNGRFPGESTIDDNLRKLSHETRVYINKAQLLLAKADELDDFDLSIIDSSGVNAYSAWPTDSGNLLKMIGAIRHGANTLLEEFNLDPMPDKQFMKSYKALKRRHFRINTVKGPRKRSKRHRHYRFFLDSALKCLDHLETELLHAEERLDEILHRVCPSSRLRLEERWKAITQTLIDAWKMHQYSWLSRFAESSGCPIEADKADRTLSVSDSDAAWIEKGGRDAVFGYRVQVARSGEGFITAIDVPRGNVADSVQLQPMVTAHKDNTGVMPNQVSVDDGYSSAANVAKLTEWGVQDISISGSKGKKLLDASDWDSDTYRDLRAIRSSAEASIFVLKHSFGFDRPRRHGRDKIEAEFLEKTLAHNLAHHVRLRRKARDEVPNAA